jgi:tetratricopeptide (TPR) repeat protein
MSDQAVEDARASLEEGDVERANEALRRAVERHPDDASLLIDLGHLAFVRGETAEAVSHFERALELEPENPDALRALSSIHRRSGNAEEALSAAQRLSDAQAEEVLAALEVADLALELGRLDEAEAAFRRLASADDDPDHAVYALHGLIEVEMRRERWRRVLDLAVDATRVDRLGRTTDILAYAVGQVFGQSEDRPAVERRDLEAELAASRAEHRQLHTEFVG